jgi:hypothetical protein
VGKLGRKVCCNFDKDVKCILIVKGQKGCVFEETTEEHSTASMLTFVLCYHHLNVNLDLIKRDSQICEVEG